MNAAASRHDAQQVMYGAGEPLCHLIVYCVQINEAHNAIAAVTTWLFWDTVIHFDVEVRWFIDALSEGN